MLSMARLSRTWTSKCKCLAEICTAGGLCLDVCVRVCVCVQLDGGSAASDDGPEAQYRSWLGRQYLQYKDHMLGLLSAGGEASSSSAAVQVQGRGGGGGPTGHACTHCHCLQGRGAL